MKARIRTIKPEIGKDEELWDLGQETGLPVYQAFTVLWCYADREGRFKWRPRQLKSDCLPYWDGDFSRVLDALASRGFIRRYAFQGREFGVVCNFLKHQFINGKEPPSELPEPPEPELKSEVTRVDYASTSREERVDDVPIPSPSHSLPDPKGGAGGADQPFVMPPDWSPVDRLAGLLMTTKVPKWAIPEMLPRFVAHFAASDETRTEREWLQSASKWLIRDWDDPKRRPVKGSSDQPHKPRTAAEALKAVGL